MLENTTTLQENAIEEHFCKPFEKAPRFEMTKENSAYLIQLLMGDKNIKRLPQKEKPFLMQLIEARVRGAFTYKMDDERLSLFLTIISKSPGTAVMYLTYIQYWCKKHNCKEVDLETFCNIFPIGFLSEDDLQKIWDGQKVKRESGSDNLLDYQTAMVSIHFVEPVPVKY